jgi:hypothetical protein
MLDFETSDNKDDLLEYAKELNVSANARLSIDSIKALIRKAVGDVDVVTSAKKIKLMIHKTEGDTGSIDVPVSVNGKTWLIKRGMEVIVPDFLVEVLENAVKEIYVQDEVTKSITKREVPAYPFSAMAI